MPTDQENELSPRRRGRRASTTLNTSASSPVGSTGADDTQAHQAHVESQPGQTPGALSDTHTVAPTRRRTTRTATVTAVSEASAAATEESTEAVTKVAKTRAAPKTSRRQAAAPAVTQATFDQPATSAAFVGSDSPTPQTRLATDAPADAAAPARRRTTRASAANGASAPEAVLSSEPANDGAEVSASQPRRRFDQRGRKTYGQPLALNGAQPTGKDDTASDDASRQVSSEKTETPATPGAPRTNARQQAAHASNGQNEQNGHAAHPSGNGAGSRISVPYNPGARANVSRPGAGGAAGHAPRAGVANTPNQPTQGRQTHQPTQGRTPNRGNQPNQPNQPAPGYAPYPPYGPGYPPTPGAPYGPGPEYGQGYGSGYPPYGQGNPGEYAPYPPYGSNYPQNYPQGYGQQWGQPNQPSPYGAPPAPYPQGYGRRDGREGYDPYAAQRQAPEYPPNRVERADRNERTRGRGYGTPYPEQNQRGYGEQRDQRERGAPTRPAPYGDQRDQRDQRGVGGRGQPPAPQRGRANRDGQGTVMPPASSLYTNVPPVAPTQPGAGPDGRYAYSPSPRPTVATYGRAVEVNGLVWQHPGHPNSPAEVLDPRTLQPIARLGADELRRMLLRPGDLIEAQAEERGGRRSIVALNSVNDEAPERLRERPIFEQLTALFPDRRIRLEHGARPISARVIDLFAPLGFGSRALIVAPPKTGKTTFIREAAESVLVGYPDAVVMAVLVGERPEEVTDLRARLEPRGGHVYAASFDESTERHAWLVQVAVERAKRVAESGRDAFMVLDSLTRLARAENLATRGQGRTLSGGIDAQALDTGRRAFGAARNLEEGGSITILATCLVDTGSRQDDVVYEEFKGTGNMEIHLSRELAQRRLFPAVDAVKSSTRREEMLLTPEELRGSTALRRRMAGLPTTEATQQLLSVMERTPSNAALLQAIEQSNASGVR